jgi:dihydroorotate dehydrogenase electron transfer subunit
VIQQVLAEVLANEAVLPGVRWLRLAAASLAAKAAPGQFVAVRCGEGADPFLRRAVPLSRSVGAEIDLLVPADEPGRRWLAAQRPGEAVDLLGPLGRGFVVDPDARNLLLVAEGLAIAPLLGLAQVAVAQGLAVTLLAGAATAAEALPARLLPAEVEYRLATADGRLGLLGSVSDLLPGALEWADQVFAAGSQTFYLTLWAAVQRQRLRAEAGFAQVWLGGTIGCGVGACLGCAIETRRGSRRVCKDGPVFDLWEIV